MKLSDVMTRQVEDVRPGATLQEVAQKMRSMDVGAIPVCENEKLIGMITDRDITVRAVAQGQDPRTACARDAMSAGLVYCYEDEDVEEAARLMEQQQIRRLPVLDRNKRLAGIVSLGDLVTRQQNQRLGGEVLEQVSQPNIPHA
ncbi:MAG TPA: CBS domain-containing protein [Tepidisphaeraceae bacterium]|jgi:CBS domain-containing protein